MSKPRGSVPRTVSACVPQGAAQPAVRRCLLCGAPATILGCFVPHQPERWGLTSEAPAPGTLRTVWYGLCENCARPGVQYVVEDRLQAKRRAVLN
jgi:hypothetical protein